MKALPKDVMNQILEELRPEKQLPGDVTIKMAMKDWGVKKSKARDMLEKEVKEGKLKKVDAILYTGRFGLLYRRVEK